MKELMKLLKGLSEDEYSAVISAIAQADSADDIIDFAKEKGVELSKENAEKIFEKISSGIDLTDSDLASRSGGEAEYGDLCEARNDPGCGEDAEC